MSNMVHVRVVGREHGRHKTGDEFDIREEVAERHPNTLEVIEDPGESGEPEVQSDEPDTCQTVKADDEVCGRELPCGYHTED